MNIDLIVVQLLIGPRKRTAHFVTGLPQRENSDNRLLPDPKPNDFVELNRTQRVDLAPLFISLLNGKLLCTNAYWQYHRSQRGGHWRRIVFVYEREGKPCGLSCYQAQTGIATLFRARMVYVHADRVGREFGRPHISVALVGRSQRPAKRKLIYEPEGDPDRPFIVVPFMPPPPTVVDTVHSRQSP
ncbi:MAG: hypothetical protein WC864_07470 [Ilumatobacteraceae bacterium]